MELVLSLKLENIFKSKDFTDKKSGEVTRGKWKIQTFDSIETEHGTQMKLLDISISEKQHQDLKDKVGQDISLFVGTYVSNGRVGFYGLDK